MPFQSPYPQDLPALAFGAGIKTPFGLAVLPPGSRVAAYVRSTGLQSGDDPFVASNLVTTLAAGLQRARSGFGDTVVVLPNHSESVTDATMLTNLVAGTRVLGFGRGSSMPTFRWTATASQWAVSVNDVVFQGLRLSLEGANGVVKAILVTGADVAFYGNDFVVTSGASNKATIALEVGAGANRFELVGNVLRGLYGTAVTDGVKVVAAVDQIRINDNEFEFAATAANGQINVTAAATNMKILRNLMENTVATATNVFNITLANVASTGHVADNRLAVIASGTTTSSGISVGAATLVRCNENYCTDEAGKSGLLTPVAAT